MLHTFRCDNMSLRRNAKTRRQHHEHAQLHVTLDDRVRQYEKLYRAELRRRSDNRTDSDDDAARRVLPNLTSDLIGTRRAMNRVRALLHMTPFLGTTLYDLRRA